MKETTKKITPKPLLLFYHKCLARLSAFFYNHPSEKIIVIGVTGTNGKSTVVNLIAKVLEEAGFKVGLASTYNFKIGGKEWLNDKKITMLGRFQLQKFLRRLLKEECQYAVIEASSEGIRQYRHLGINYDLAVFTNLTPEHIEAHGSFENYKKAKGRLFSHLSERRKKNIKGKTVNKVIIVNLDDEHAEYFLGFKADEKYGFTLKGRKRSNIKVVSAEDISVNDKGSRFRCAGENFNFRLLGEFNIANSLAAMAVGVSQNIEPAKIKAALEKIDYLPGRLEFIDEGQDFKILVDYAPEVESMKKLYEVVALLDKKRIIHVLGSCGGGRDKARRPVLGRIAGRQANIVIVTNEDPYDENPEKIINQVAAGVEETGKIPKVNLFKILSRKEAISLALKKAREGDLVLITGKGAEQAICLKGGKKIPWDDRRIVRKAIRENS